MNYEERQSRLDRINKIFRINRISFNPFYFRLGDLRFCLTHPVNPENLVNPVYLWCVVFLFFLSVPSVQAQGRKPAAPPVERITDSVVRVGSVVVDTQARTVTCPGVINMDSGAIEYLAVGPKGKLHESLLQLDVKPSYLQVGLLLLGLEPKNVLRVQGDNRTPQGAKLELRIQWRDKNGKEQDVRAEALMIEMPGKKAVSVGPWVFTGSRILKEGFEADLSQSLIAVWRDPAAIIDNPRPGGARNAYLVNEKRAPKRGTKVELVIRALPDEKRTTKEARRTKDDERRMTNDQ